MKEGKERIKKDLKGIKILFMVLIVYDARKCGKITKDNKVLAH
jgi:hypothetical protein